MTQDERNEALRCMVDLMIVAMEWEPSDGDIGTFALTVKERIERRIAADEAKENA